MTLFQRFAWLASMMSTGWLLLALAAAWLGYGSLERHRAKAATPSLVLAWLLLVLPVLVLLWGAVAYGWEAPIWGRPRRVWPTGILSGLAATELVLAIYVGYRHRGSPRFALPAAIVGVGFTAFAWLLGAMAIANDWI